MAIFLSRPKRSIKILRVDFPRCQPVGLDLTSGVKPCDHREFRPENLLHSVATALIIGPLAARANEGGSIRVSQAKPSVHGISSSLLVALAAMAAVLALPSVSQADLAFNVAAGGWPNDAHRDAAIAAIQSSINRYNAYGDFGNHNIHVYYNAGIPTAQANYLGSIGFGGTYPNERVMMHELAHYLGSGTAGDPWDGARGEAMVDQFDGLEASLNGDANHFWPYGLNFDSEGAEINKQRAVALVYAQRADLGIGSGTIAGATGAIHLTSSDPFGESGFNYASRWSDTHFAHPGADYSTGNFLMRTPDSGNSFAFVGDSLTVNNTNGVNGGLLYKGVGSTGVTTFKNLILDGGYVRHASQSGDLFRLAGRVTLNGSSTIDAAQGEIVISANIEGSGSLNKTGGHTVTLNGNADYAGDTNINGGTLRLVPIAPVASYAFNPTGRGTVVTNSGTGGASMSGTLANGATIVAGGKYGTAVSLSGGASVDINNPIIDLGSAGNWTVSAWVKTTTPGASLLTKGNGSGWSNGNTIFYLGDGTAGGSGGIPSAVRWGGGFFQGSNRAASVNNDTWRQITYVNDSGDYELYVDGVPQPLSAGNSSFANADIGSIVRLGVSTNTFAGDGTVNFNGLLDDVHFYSHALSAAQVADLHQATSTFAPLPIATHVSIASGATLDVNGAVQQIGSLSGAIGAVVTLGNGRLTVDSPANSQFAGEISGAGGSLVKQGAGTLILSGAISYTGATAVNAGTLRVNGNIAADSAVTVNGGTLAGTGTLAGLVTINGGGHIAPGASIESLDVGSLTLAAGSILDFELATVADADTSDLINVTNSNGLTVNGGLLNLANIGSMTSGTYKLIDYLGALTGSVSNIALGSTPSGFNFSLINNIAATSIDLLVSTQLLGDYNNNGQVDAADYTVWRNTLDTSVTPGSGADGNFDGHIDHGDYYVWKTNFGNTNDTPDGQSVPEPTSLLLAALGTIALITRRPLTRKLLRKKHQSSRPCRELKSASEFHTARITYSNRSDSVNSAPHGRSRATPNGGRRFTLATLPAQIIVGVANHEPRSKTKTRRQPRGHSRNGHHHNRPSLHRSGRSPVRHDLQRPARYRTCLDRLEYAIESCCWRLDSRKLSRRRSQWLEYQRRSQYLGRYDRRFLRRFFWQHR